MKKLSDSECIGGCGELVGANSPTGMCRNCRRKAARRQLKLVMRKLPEAGYKTRKRSHAKNS